MKHNNSSSTMYIRLLAMAILSFISMYFLMYAMVDSFTNIHNSFNELYMAGLMTAPMILIEIVLMGGMYENKNYNIAIAIASILVGIIFFFAIRTQFAVGDTQFLRSMIPHHAAALLMVNGAKINDPQIRKLADDIISSQQKEIDFMKAKLKEMNK